MHVDEAKRTLGSRIPWICDNMDNDLKHALCNRPNSEFIIDPDGKIVVASNEDEAKLLENTAKRGKLNGLKGLKYLSDNELKEREPFVSSYKSLLVPEEGIVDYMGVMLSMKQVTKKNLEGFWAFG